MIFRIRVILFILIAVAVAVLVFEATRPYRPGNLIDSYIDDLIGRDISVADEYHPVYIELPADADLNGFIPISEERQGYKDGDMTLIIPSLDFSQAVSDGTSQADLKRGPGLFEASGMPGVADANVSIAGHRSHNMFYYLDRLGAGDNMQIVYGSYVFTYVYYDTEVILPSDWSVISEQGFACCTLITCTPIVEANKRLVVRFMLEGVTDVSEHQPEREVL